MASDIIKMAVELFGGGVLIISLKIKRVIPASDYCVPKCLCFCWNIICRAHIKVSKGAFQEILWLTVLW